MPAARNYGLDAGRTAGGSAGGAAHLPAPVESRCTPTYTAKPYASWPGWCVNYGQNVRYSISSITIGTGYLDSSCAHRRRTLAYLQSRDEPMNALGSSHMTK